MKQLILECENVNKRFRWYERSNSLKESFTRLLKPASQKYEWDVLKNINIKIYQGEKIGIIGKNGCGKSTLLKMITGIHTPNSGTINMFAKRMLALIELGVGFYPDLTGRENITLNWAFNGLSKNDLKKKFDEIIQFSGVEQFLDTPLKYFSSGMIARLGFSVSIHANPDLLIIDEALTVGDEEFQGKCYEKIEEVCESGTTLILVSHNMSDISRACERAIWLNQGTIAYDGNADKTIEMYMQSVKKEHYEKMTA